MNRFEFSQDEADIKTIDECFGRLVDSGFSAGAVEFLMERMMLAGLVSKYATDDKIAARATVFTDRGFAIINAFRDLQKAIGPLGKLEVITLYCLAITSEDIQPG